MEGWIKLHRKILDNPIIMKDSDHLAVWIYLLAHATHKEYPALFKGKKIMLQPGQLITGRKTIGEALRIEETKVKRILTCFENDQQIARQRSNKNSLISILQWDKYQESAQQNAQQMPNECPADAQQVPTNKNVKNVKKVKKVLNINNIMCKRTALHEASKEEVNSFFEDLWKTYPVKKGKGQVSATQRKVLYKIGADEMHRAIQRYLTELKKDADWRKPQNGSTFFNSGYVDYLDKNFEPQAAQSTGPVLDESKTDLDHLF